MPDYTIETTYHLPAYRQRTYSAETVPDACRLAIEDEDWDGEKQSYEDASEAFISGIWEGRDAAYSGTVSAIPSQFGVLTPHRRLQDPKVRLFADFIAREVRGVFA